MPDDDDHHDQDGALAEFVPFGESPFDGALPVALISTAAAVHPVVGIGVGVASYVAAKLTSNAAFHQATLNGVADVVTDGSDSRRERYARAHDQQEQQRVLVDWITDDLKFLWVGIEDVRGQARRIEDLEGRVAELEIFALQMIGQFEVTLRQRPDPEMRPYLLNAWANTLRRPAFFTPTWVRRLNGALVSCGADHLRQLLAYYWRAEDAEPNGWRPVKLSQQEFRDLHAPDSGLLVLEDLLAAKLAHRTHDQNGSLILLTVLGMRLAEFVSRPGEAGKRPPLVI